MEIILKIPQKYSDFLEYIKAHFYTDLTEYFMNIIENEIQSRIDDLGI